MASITTTTLKGNMGASAGSPGDGAFGSIGVAILSGSGNVYTGGDANSLVLGVASDSVVTLGNGEDTVLLAGSNNLVTLGTPGGTHLPWVVDQVWLQGSNNSVTAFGSANVFLQGDNNSTSLTDAGSVPGMLNVLLSGTGDHVTQGSAGRGTLNVVGIGGGNYVDVKESGTLLLGGQQNTVIVESGSHLIQAGSGQDYVTLGGTGSQVVQLAGRSNQVGGTGHATITGGSGATALTLGLAAGGDSAYSVALGGAGNSISVGSGDGSHGHVSIDAGSGGDVVHLAGAGGNVTFHGAGNMLFLASLDGSAPLSVTDMGAGLGITISAASQLGTGAAPLTVHGFDTTGLIDFRPGVCGLTSVSQVMADLHGDGAGGSVLSLPGVGQATTMIHFVGSTHLTAANFAVG